MIKFILLFCIANFSYAFENGFYQFTKDADYTQAIIDIKGVTKEYQVATHYFKQANSKKEE